MSNTVDKEAIQDKIVNFINEKYNLNLLTVDSAAMAEDIYNLLGGDWRRERCPKDVNPARQSCHSILKEVMNKPYCGKTRFDFLDEEELPMIYAAMDFYAASLLKERDELKRDKLYWQLEAQAKHKQITQLQSTNEAKEKELIQLRAFVADVVRGQFGELKSEFINRIIRQGKAMQQLKSKS